MALFHPAFRDNFFHFVPRLLSSTPGLTHLAATNRLTQILSQHVLSTSSISLPSVSWGLSGLLSDIWEGVLRAVPKKKTSHSKKRHRQLAGKALKDVKAINTCPACLKPKKAHTLCPYCVAEIKEGWRQAAKDAAA